MNITISNCNYFLTKFYKTRDMIGAGIDRAIVNNRPETVAKLEKEYEEICNRIDQFLEFRRNNPGCLLEGDPGYGPV